MSRVFYDHIIVLEELEEEINKIAPSHDAKFKLWQMIDEITHFRVLHRTLKLLPKNHHRKFLMMLHQAPYEPEIMYFLMEKTEGQIEKSLKQEKESILQDLRDLFAES